VPPTPPAAQFGAATVYNITDGTMTEVPRLLPSVDGTNKIAKNDDGSIELCFGPRKPPNVAASNWIQTVDGRDFLVVPALWAGCRVLRPNLEAR
jgi:hypothetical protein